MLGYYLISKKHSDDLDNEVQKRTDELEKERKYIQKILDTNPTIIVVTSYSNIQRVNQRFFDFFGFKDLDTFKEKYSCVCDFFVSLNNIPFPEDRIINGKLWCNYLADKKTKEDYFVTLKLNDQLFYFTISATYLNNKQDILLTFQNITDLKQKDKLLFEQSKMASMGEMIGNIAHQWRQPLSVISTSATGLQIYQEYNNLTEEKVKNACELINKNAQFLSTTIDDFKNFIKGENKKSTFYLQDAIDQLLQIINPVIKNNKIKLVFTIQEDLQITSYSNELIQCLMNICNNAKDALISVNESDRYIFFTALASGDNITITIKDSGGGIDEQIISKIFEPYFTTKHQSQGTGLGLHMSYNLVVNGMNGTIEASNANYTYKDKEYRGASFKITLPIK
jgi:signal transduction histidine kinase